jgi:HK97 family phage portal protein
MGWLSRLVERERKALVVNGDTTALWTSGKAHTGRRVDVDTALSQITVFACVNLISESVGMVPLVLYRRLEGRGKEEATNHPLYRVLHYAPNPESTAQEDYEYKAACLALWGNAYSEIEFDGAGRRRAVWPLRPDRMTVGVDEQNRRVYDYLLPSGDTVRLDRWRVWHIKGWGTDPWVGKSRIGLAREAIGLALATEEFGGRFFANDSRPGGVLKHPTKLSNEAKARVKASWEDMHRGLDNANRVAVLEEGLEWQTIGVPPEDAQFLETRTFQRSEICSLFRVPPHMVGIVENSTSWGTGIGQQTQGFVTFDLGPYLTRIAQSAYRDLLSPSEQQRYFAEFRSAALVQNDLPARWASYMNGLTTGVYSINDVLEKENMNPIPGGDVHLVPLNMQRLEDAGKGAETGQTSETGRTRRSAPTDADAGEANDA